LALTFTILFHVRVVLTTVDYIGTYLVEILGSGVTRK